LKGPYPPGDVGLETPDTVTLLVPTTSDVAKVVVVWLEYPVGNVMDIDPIVIAVVQAKLNVYVTPDVDSLFSLNSIGLLYHASMG